MKKFSKSLIYLGTALLTVACQNEDLISPEKKFEEEPQSMKVPISEARNELYQLLTDLNNKGSRSEFKLKRVIENEWSTTISKGESRSEEDDLEFYIFNFNDGQGYAVMSGDRRMPSLIALSENGSLNPGDTISNPGAAMFYSLVDSGDISISIPLPPNPWDPIDPDMPTPDPTYPMYGDWENIVYHEGGYCPVKWGQSMPYNKYCPEKDGSRCVTGCVATATAQLMAFWKYPNYYENYTFRWDEMLAFPYASNCDYKGQNDIGRVMQLLGLNKNLDMNYGVDASGADANNIMRTLKNFGYSQSGTRRDFSTLGAVNELKNGVPIILDGYSKKVSNHFMGITLDPTYENGHAWIAHGLLERKREVMNVSTVTGQLVSTTTQTEWYLLCNWGWSGNQDGYFLSGVFDSLAGPSFGDNTSSSRADGDKDGYYRHKLKMIVNIRK